MDSERTSSLFLVLLAIFILYGSARLGMGTAGAPGPGFLPFWGAAVLLLTSAVQLFSRISSRATTTDKTRTGFWVEAGWRKVIYVVVALAIYSLLFETLGFILCTFFLMTFLLTVIETRRWHVILIESVLITLASYFIFEKGLTTGFPKGVLGF